MDLDFQYWVVEFLLLNFSESFECKRTHWLSMSSWFEYSGAEFSLSVSELTDYQWVRDLSADALIEFRWVHCFECDKKRFSLSASELTDYQWVRDLSAGELNFLWVQANSLIINEFVIWVQPHSLSSVECLALSATKNDFLWVQANSLIINEFVIWVQESSNFFFGKM